MTSEPHASDAPPGNSLHGRFRTFASLRVPAYRRYFSAMFLYFGAMQMTVLARPWLAFDLSADESGQRSALVLGLTVAANTAPSLVLSPWAGALADRMSKRTMLMVAGALMAAFALATAAGLAMDAFSWWHVTILGVFQGVVMTFITPSRRAIISELVDREHLLNAVALHTVQQNLNRTMMPALAGFVIALAGAEWAYVVIAAFYVIAVTALFTVPAPRAAASAPSRRTMSGAVGDGFRYGARDPVIRTLLLIGLVGAVFGQPIQHLLPLFQDVLDIGPGRLGVLFTFFGIGSLMGSTTAASVGDFRRKGLLLMGFFIVLGVSIVAFALSSYYLLSLAILVPVGVGHSGRVAVHVATLQTYSAPEMRGRVMALNAMQGGVMPFSVLGITALADILNPQIALAATGSVILVYGLGELVFSKRLRSLE